MDWSYRRQDSLFFLRFRYGIFPIILYLYFLKPGLSVFVSGMVTLPGIMRRRH